MEELLYREPTGRTENVAATASKTSNDWRHKLPVLNGLGITLREVRSSDAASLFAMMTAEEVTRFISPPPASLDGFEKFIAWANRQRAEGRYACFAVTLRGFDTAIGLFQIKCSDGDPSTAEWGFAIGSPFWGSGVFQQGAELLIRFAFDVLGVNRLEARAAVHNGRGIGALHKIGAVEEGLLRRAFYCKGQHMDQFLFAIVREDWYAAKHSNQRYHAHVH
jgi:[ribosomal protein S5]-alanine N-acetyltransferase